MAKTIDCLLVGHNEMDFAEYEKAVRNMGVNSGAYRDLNLSFIHYNHRPYPVAEIFNALRGGDNAVHGAAKPLHLGETFSASIAYLGTYLQRRGLTFDYVNSFQYEKDELKEKLEKCNPLTVAVTTTFYVSVLPLLEIINFIKKYNRRAKIIVGGPFISTQVREQDPLDLEYLFNTTIGADIYVNSSQGEAALVEIIYALKKGLSPGNINNIYYNTGNGYRATPIVKENNKLSENPVDWNLFVGNTGEYVNVRTAVSCPFSCSFCGFPQHAGQYQVAGIEQVEMELAVLDKIRTVKYIHFVDDTFNIPPERFKEILRMMIKHKFRFRWHSYLRCQAVDNETAALMKQSGCDGAFLGIESGSNQILKNMNKAVTRDQLLKGIEILKRYEIVTFGNFITGFPGETDETVRETVEFIKQSGLDFYRTQLWYCEPITPIWNEREKYQIEGENFEWSHCTMDKAGACNYIEEIFLTVDNAVWIPQYNFDFATFWHLVYRGFSIRDAAKFLNAFNNGVKEKLRNPVFSSQNEVSFQIIKEIKDACSVNKPVKKDNSSKIGIMDKYHVKFDF
jgi:anaerobic magnesium-protoporphyrin IX monomethyl ester cyclase